jgi:hypothetical protein
VLNRRVNERSGSPSRPLKGRTSPNRVLAERGNQFKANNGKSDFDLDQSPKEIAGDAALMTPTRRGCCEHQVRGLAATRNLGQRGPQRVIFDRLSMAWPLSHHPPKADTGPLAFMSTRPSCRLCLIALVPVTEPDDAVRTSNSRPPPASLAPYAVTTRAAAHPARDRPRNHLSADTPDQQRVSTAHPLVYHAALRAASGGGFACQA